MISPVQAYGIRDPKALAGPLAQAGEAQQAQRAHGALPAQPNKPEGIENSSPLEGISGPAKANAYLYWPKEGREGQASAMKARANPSPMERMRLWSQAVSNTLTGNTAYGGNALPANLVRAADRGRGALSGKAIQYKGGGKSASDNEPGAGCKTCASREYKDDSGDAGVTFQSAQSIPASTAGVMIAAHEGQHATRETARAQEEGEVITNKKVTFQYGCCPECNRMYIKGGLTSITKMSKGDSGNAVAARMADMMGGVGEKVNMGV